MKGNRFCALVIGEDGNIYRPQTGIGYQPCYGEFLNGSNERQLWVPGRVVDIEFRRRPRGERYRPTHPEDYIVRTVQVGRGVMTADHLARHVRSLAQRRLGELMPGITVEYARVYYVGTPELERSAGYLHVRDIEIIEHRNKQYARVRPWLGNRFWLPIKCPDLLGKLERGEIRTGSHIPGSLVLTGLTGPFLHKQSQETRAYLQLLHILP